MTTPELQPRKPCEIEIRLLGPFQVFINGTIVLERYWSRPKPKTLLKLLALEANHSLHCEEVRELLWPQLPPEKTAKNLHRAVYIVRQALSKRLVEQDSDEILSIRAHQLFLQAPGGVWVDVIAFEQMAKTALAGSRTELYEEALTLYRGEFLSEDRYEEWTSLRREQLRATHRLLLCQLAKLYENTEHFSRRITLLQQLTTSDPADQAAHRALASDYLRAGLSTLAEQQLDSCLRIVEKEPDTEPEAATIELLQNIRSAKTVSSNNHSFENQSAGIAPSLSQTPMPTLEVKRSE